MKSARERKKKLVQKLIPAEYGGRYMESAGKSRCTAIDSRNSNCYKQVSEIQTVTGRVQVT